MDFWRPDVDVLLTDSEDEEEENLKRDFKGREALLFIIDAALYKEKDRLRDALEIVRLAFISGLLASSKDVIGVVFTNTKMSPQPDEQNFLDNIVIPKHCAIYLPILQITQPIVQHYLEYLTTVADTFEREYGFIEDGGSFASTMRLCIDLFEHCGYQLNNATIIYLTDQAIPHTRDSHEFSMALTRATDLEGKEIEFHVIPMVDDFDYEPFYKEFMTLVRDVELDSFVVPDAQQLREILCNRKLKMDFLKRCMGHFRFHLGPDLVISAQYYNYFKRKYEPRKVTMLLRNNAIVTTKNIVMVCKMNSEMPESEVAQTVKANEGWYEINLGNVAIRITVPQMLRVRNLHAPGMMLLGFKASNELPDNWYYLPANFMYPDDQSIRGSKCLFRALWEACLTRQKIAICLFLRKRNSLPRYVALVPKRTPEKSEGSFRSLLYGDGFQIVYLPMANHIRNLSLKDWCPIQNLENDEGTKAFEQVIKKLRIRYEPNLVNNPAMEQLQSELLALSLNIRTEKDGVTSMPEPPMQDMRIAKYIPEINTIFDKFSDLASKKRTRNGDTDKSQQQLKRQKLSEEMLKNYEQLMEIIKNDELSICTISQLKFILDQHFEIKTSGTKTVLMDRIKEHFANSSTL